MKKVIFTVLTLLLLNTFSSCQAKPNKEFASGANPIEKVMLGNDERTLFSLTSEFPFDQSLLLNWLAIEKTDISTYEQKLVLIDSKGYKYTFFELPTSDQGVIVVSSSKGTTIQYYAGSFGFADSIIEGLKKNYPTKFIINELPDVRFTEGFLDGLENYTESEMMALNQVMSDKINSLLKLPTRYKTNVTPNLETIKPYVLKDENGLYYVICFHNNLIGVGVDPLGVLTYYTLDSESTSLIGDYFYRIPVVPVGRDLSSLTLQSFNSQELGTYAEQFIDLSVQQGNEVSAILDLPHHVTVTLDLDVDNYQELFGFKASDGLLYWFFRNNETSKTYIRVDYNGNQNGLTYYEYVFEGREPFLEVMQYLTKLVKK